LVARTEAIVGERLLERRPVVQLTPAGALFLGSARDALHEIERGMEGVRRLAAGSAGQLNLGFPGWVVATPVPDAVAVFHRRYPDVELTLLDLNTADQIQALKSRRLHLGLILAPPEDPDLLVEPLYAEPWLAVVPAAHALARGSEVDPRALEKEPFVSFPRQLAPALHDQVGTLVDRNRLRVVQEAGAWITLIAMVRTGVGVSIVPASMRRLWSEGVAYLPLKGVEVEVSVAVCRGAGHMPPAVGAFLEVLHAEIAEVTQGRGALPSHEPPNSRSRSATLQLGRGTRDRINGERT
jgi:DNA-binding transcriptional LysR family regulator